MTSASLTANKLVAKDSIKMVFTSGEVNAENIETSDLGITLTSGKVVAKSLTATKVSLTATSGKLNIDKIKVGEFSSEVTSGVLNFNFLSFIKADLNMTSGNAYIDLPEDGGIVTIDKTSGRVVINREHTVNNNQYTFGTSDSKMSIDYTSGKVVIQ